MNEELTMLSNISSSIVCVALYVCMTRRNSDQRIVKFLPTCRTWSTCKFLTSPAPLPLFCETVTFGLISWVNSADQCFVYFTIF